MSGSYHIPDEPLPSSWSKLAVNPVHPLLAAMLAGQWLAWPWFIVNALALGSPTAKREIRTVILGALATLILSIGLLWIDSRTDLSDTAVRLLILSLTTTKLLIAYRVHTLQSKTYEIFQHFNGQTKNALGIVLLASFLLRPIILGVTDNVLWKLVLAGGM